MFAAHQRQFDLVLLHLLDVEGAASIGPAGERGDDLRRQLLDYVVDTPRAGRRGILDREEGFGQRDVTLVRSKGVIASLRRINR
ncbi:hypothetical protein EOA75_19765 [Mesorhizobium sp. M1A.F.Ca.IN.022.07.1.1]|nr:hypothetical protein EOA75_19765 [Mesorhizobium sp. M1A.F.Ca.IN.022.07.1.1]RWM65083.1 MAG: hypothetical protein EOR82_31390 [Mesorhizobium sp.]RWM89346.1 MAG: hypothetical protein EOR86_29860 [Mesorhizobium sp.]TJV54531.1 MAG: hypothetical protein E5X82_31335 [Mesorhizobium sp.]